MSICTLDIIADLSKRWQVILFTRPLIKIKRTLKMIPHLLKQNGIARMLTPIMLLPKLTVDLKVPIFFDHK